MVAMGATFPKSSRLQAAAVICAGVASGFLTPQILNFVDSLNYPRRFSGVVLAVGGVPFALLIVAIARIASGTDWWRAIALGVATLVAMSVAITLSADTNVALRDWAEPGRDLIAGPIGGVIGSGLMTLAALALRIGPRHAAGWMPLLLVGTGLGTLLAVDAWLNSENVWVIFPVWQACVAIVFLRTLQNSHATDDAS
jgi:hypothetical protein